MAPCQEIPGTAPQTGAAPETQSRHILGLIPNYRTSPSLQNYKPLTVGEKFKIASEDSLDRGTFVMAGLFGGLGQLTDSNKSFGHGAAGFGRYFGTSYGDLFIGNYMTEALYPSHPPPGSPILPAWHRKRPLPVRLRRLTGLLDPSRLWRHSVQLLRMAGELNCRSDIKCLLSGSTERRQRDFEIGYAGERRCLRQRPEGVLARPAPQIQ